MLRSRSAGTLVENSTNDAVMLGSSCFLTIWPLMTSQSSSGMMSPREPTWINRHQATEDYPWCDGIYLRAYYVREFDPVVVHLLIVLRDGNLLAVAVEGDTGRSALSDAPYDAGTAVAAPRLRLCWFEGLHINADVADKPA